MANEFKHKDIGPECERTEWEGVDTHEADSQAAGDIIYCDGTYWKRVAKGANGLYLKAGSVPYWQAILEADIPAAIARDAEVAADIATHAALVSAHHTKFTNAEHDLVARHPLANLDPLVCSEAEADGKVSTHSVLATGIHGLGALHAAGFHSAGQAASKIFWIDEPVLALQLDDQTEGVSWTDLDLTAHTSENAKFALIYLWIRVDSYSSGVVKMEARKNGTAPAMSMRAWGSVATVSNNYSELLVIIGLDALRKMEYQTDVSGTAQADFRIYVMGYIE